MYVIYKTDAQNSFQVKRSRLREVLPNYWLVYREIPTRRALSIILCVKTRSLTTMPTQNWRVIPSLKHFKKSDWIKIWRLIPPFYDVRFQPLTMCWAAIHKVWTGGSPPPWNHEKFGCAQTWRRQITHLGIISWETHFGQPRINAQECHEHRTMTVGKSVKNGPG